MENGKWKIKRKNIIRYPLIKPFLAEIKLRRFLRILIF
jgi:hypothetical protein